MTAFLENISRACINGQGVSYGDALKIALMPEAEIFEILPYSEKIRRHFKGTSINLCSIVNAKSGLCREDCSFCAQSSHHPTDIKTYPMVSADKILKSAQDAENFGAREFSIVTSGTGISKKQDVSTLKQALKTMKEKTRLETCASLGIMDKDVLKELKESGLESYHHNLETSERFFPNVCSTHDYSEDIETIKTAKTLGFYVCSGGIFGLGEDWEDRVTLAMTLRELNVDSVPINFLNPRPGTPLEGAKNLTPLVCLKIVALYRFILPAKDIVVCGGREINLRDLQPLIFSAGANGMMVGDYLTTKGRLPKDDLQMLNDLGLTPRR